MLSDNQCSSNVVKTLMGDDRPTTFYADVRRDGHYRPICKGMVRLKCFMGGWCCFPRG